MLDLRAAALTLESGYQTFYPTLNGEVLTAFQATRPTVAGRMTIKMLRASVPGAAKAVEAAMVRARLRPRLKG